MTELQQQCKFKDQSVDLWQKEVDKITESINHCLAALKTGTIAPKNAASVIGGLLIDLQDANLHLATAKCERRELSAVIAYGAEEKWKKGQDEIAESFKI